MAREESLRAGENIKELTVRGIILGAVLTVILTAANVYAGLKIGLTVATSIPAAVVSMAVLPLAWICASRPILTAETYPGNRPDATRSSSTCQMRSKWFMPTPSVLTGQDRSGLTNSSHRATAQTSSTLSPRCTLPGDVTTA